MSKEVSQKQMVDQEIKDFEAQASEELAQEAQNGIELPKVNLPKPKHGKKRNWLQKGMAVVVENKETVKAVGKWVLIGTAVLFVGKWVKDFMNAGDEVYEGDYVEGDFVEAATDDYSDAE